jgi:hypothetical protein
MEKTEQARAVELGHPKRVSELVSGFVRSE